MTGRIVQIDAPAHKAAYELLPWYVNGTLDAAEQAMVDAHLQHCSRCQAEVEWQRQLRTAHQALPPASNADRAFAQLRAQLGQPASRPPWFDHLRQRWWRSPGWARWTMALQAAAIAALVAIIGVPPNSPPTYRGLGSADTTTANLVVTIRPQTTEQALRRLLQAQQARIVGGPTVTDAYLLRVPPGRETAIAAALRADPAIALAEPLAAGGRP